MATRVFAQSLAVGGRSFLSSISRSHTTSSSIFLRNCKLFRLRPLVATSYTSYFRHVSTPRGFATRPTSSSLSDPNPNWSNRPPKETILLDGCDFEHWLVVMEKPEGEPTRDEIIDSYIKKLAEVVGSDEEARKKIYSVSTRHYFAFGANVSEELSYKLKELDKVRWVLPDSYLDVKNKDYGGEPFIDGQAVPYHPKYHEEWVRNNARANERNRRNDRPRQFDRSRNFERRRDPQINQNFASNNMPGQPNAPSPGQMQSNMPGHPSFNNNMPPPAAPNTGGTTQPNYAPNMTHPSNGGNNMPGVGGQPNYNSNMAQHAPQNPGTMQPNYAPNMTSPPNSPYTGRVQNNMGGGYPNSGPGSFPPNNTGYVNGPPNSAGGGTRYGQPPVSGEFGPRGGPNQGQYQNPNVGPNGNNFSQPPPGYVPGQAYHAPNMAQNQAYHAPNMAQNQVHNPYQGYAPNGPNAYQPPDHNASPQVENVPTRD